MTAVGKGVTTNSLLLKATQKNQNVKAVIIYHNKRRSKWPSFNINEKLRYVQCLLFKKTGNYV